MIFKTKFIDSNFFWQSLKIFLTLYISILIPVYWYYYGPQNFLWLSDFGLFLTVAALWLDSGLLMSMAAVGVMVVELAWNIDFFLELCCNMNPIHLSDYMFNASYPLVLRLLSLFHVITPVIWIFYLKKNCYDTRALYYFTVLYWVSLFFIYFFTNPTENISWVFWPQVYSVNYIPEKFWIVCLFIFFPSLIFFPTHYIFKRFFKACK